MSAAEPIHPRTPAGSDRLPVALQPRMAQQSALELTTVGDAAGFAALADGWDELVGAMARPTPFLLHAWLEEWWRHLSDGARLAVGARGRIWADFPGRGRNIFRFVDRRTVADLYRAVPQERSLLELPGARDRAGPR